jgi:CheY-like chemotaxis protein
MVNVLVLAEDECIRFTCAEVLARMGFRPNVGAPGDACAVIPDAILIWEPGVADVRATRAAYPDVPLLVCTWQHRQPWPETVEVARLPFNAERVGQMLHKVVRGLEGPPDVESVTHAPAQVPAISGRLGALLLIEDNHALRDSLVEVIEAQGIEVRGARDGIEGLNLLRAGLRPRAVFLDSWMPNLDGAGVLTAMTSDARLANIPVVWMSGDVAEPPSEVAAFLEKPFRVDTLLDLVRALYESA